MKKVLLEAFSAIVKKIRIANYQHGNHFELTLIKEPYYKNNGSEKLYDLLINILLEFKKGYKFERKSNTIWDGLVNNREGEHYQLLPAVIRATKANKVVEIGTYMGASTYAILANTNVHISTFDIVAWHKFNSYLIHSDFNSGRITQVLADLSNLDNFNNHKDVLIEADLIFLDAPKDGLFEYKFWQNILANKETFIGKIILIDDIRVATMIDFWDKINFPKIDLGSIGHWSGTGLVLID